jgi:ABC-type molybdate transport system substrate-binding protein
MVVLNRSKDKPAVLAFWRFMQSNEAADVVRDSGYDAPGVNKREPHP